MYIHGYMANMDLYENKHVHGDIDIKRNQSKHICQSRGEGVGVLSDFHDTPCLIYPLPLENHRKYSDPTEDEDCSEGVVWSSLPTHVSFDPLLNSARQKIWWETEYTS